MPFRQPLAIEDYIDALGDEEVDLRNVVEIEPGYHNQGPRIMGDGPATASTSTTLARRDEVVWDTNGYYRELGFRHSVEMVLGGYAQLTRKDILRAVKARAVEVVDARQAYCTKQLLNREVRGNYHAVNIGDCLFDEYWEDFFKRQAEEEVARMQSQGHDISVQDILDQWGLTAEADEPEFDDDGVGLGYAPPEKPEPQQITIDWSWSFYVWHARRVNLAHMQEWQHLLIKALRQNARMGRRYNTLENFAVGVMGYGNSPDCPEVDVNWVDNHPVFFIRSDVPPTKKKAQESIRNALKLGLINNKVRN